MGALLKLIKTAKSSLQLEWNVANELLHLFANIFFSQKFGNEKLIQIRRFCVKRMKHEAKTSSAKSSVLNAVFPN